MAEFDLTTFPTLIMPRLILPEALRALMQFAFETLQVQRVNVDPR